VNISRCCWVKILYWISAAKVSGPCEKIVKCFSVDKLTAHCTVALCFCNANVKYQLMDYKLKQLEGHVEELHSARRAASRSCGGRFHVDYGKEKWGANEEHIKGWGIVKRPKQVVTKPDRNEKR
jgi:hypothetical protein